MSPGKPGERLASLLKLTPDQKAKAAALRKEYEPKLHDAFQKKIDAILTADQRKAKDAAVKAAKAAGKKGPEVFQAVRSAVKLTDDQKKKLASLRGDMPPVVKEFHDKLAKILTPEQKVKLDKLRQQWNMHQADKKPEQKTPDKK